MEMKVNSALIVAERQKRAWSQQHLATAAGLSLRTVQRIESDSRLSYESAQALASCLQIPLSEVMVRENTKRRARAKVAVSALVAAVAAGFAFVSVQRVSAQQVLLDVGVTRSEGDNLNRFNSQMLLDDGEEIELPMEGEFNVVLAPTVLANGEVVLSIKLYEFRDSVYELIGEPRLVTSDGTAAEIAVSAGSDSERIYQIAITPQVQ
jgi:transcriptional regulator with XRE-family HTH domain